MSYRGGKAALIGVAVALFTCLLVVPGAALAQSRFSVESQGGVALPASRLADLTDAGANVGLQFAYHVRPTVTLNLIGDVDFLNGQRLSNSARSPDMRLWHYGLGVEKRFKPAGMKKVSIAASLGAGATTFASDEFGATSSRRDFNQTYFSTNGGLRLGYAVNRSVTTFVGSKAYWMNTDRKDTAALAALDPASVKSFSSAWTIPVVAGVNVKL